MGNGGKGKEGELDLVEELMYQQYPLLKIPILHTIAMFNPYNSDIIMMSELEYSLRKINP